jgi:hypothetical protein
VSHTIIEGRLAWIQIASGDVSVNGRALMAGDGIPIRGPLEVALTGTPRGEVLLFDMG